MSNSADQLIYRAVQLLDENRIEQAIDKLHEAITVAEVANHPLELVRAHTILGELLAQIGENDLAIEEFRGVVTAAERFTGDVTLVDEEVASANKWLADLTKQEN